MRAAKIILSLMTLALTIGFAFAQDAEPNCSEAASQMELNFCAYKDYEAEDKTLNAVWGDVKSAVRKMDADTGSGKTEAMDALVSAQRGWIALRDGECVLAGFEAYGGSMRPMLVSGCLATMTKARTKQLSTYLNK